jgi:hypothetical protein
MVEVSSALALTILLPFFASLSHFYNPYVVIIKRKRLCNITVYPTARWKSVHWGWAQ